jgi:hypothetical protein
VGGAATPAEEFGFEEVADVSADFDFEHALRRTRRLASRS